MTTMEVGQESATRAAPEASAPWRAELDRVVRAASGGLVGGLVSGLLVAGVGGRIAMRVVALQSPSGYQGLTTDDGAATGEITLTGTLGLIAFVGLAGCLGGVVYSAMRTVLPDRGRPAAWGIVTGVVVGSMVVHSDGVDYAVLGSRWVSVAMFVAISAGYGALAAHISERLLRPEGWARRSTPVRVGLPFLAMLPGLMVVPVAAGALAVATARRVRPLRQLAGSRVVVLAARVGLVLLIGLALVDLARTVSELA